MKKSWQINIKTVSEANCFEHWRKKHDRHKAQKRFIRLWAIENNIGRLKLPLTVKLTRFAPGMLDEDDNLRMALKYCKDYIADSIIPGLAAGRADGDKRIKWEYNQERSSIYAIRIEIDTPDEQQHIGNVDSPRP